MYLYGLEIDITRAVGEGRNNRYMDTEKLGWGGLSSPIEKLKQPPISPVCLL